LNEFRLRGGGRGRCRRRHVIIQRYWVRRSSQEFGVVVIESSREVEISGVQTIADSRFGNARTHDLFEMVNLLTFLGMVS